MERPAECEVCHRSADNLFETSNEGVFACDKCQPLSIVPEVTINETPTQDDVMVVIDDGEVEPGGNTEGALHCSLCNKYFHKNLQYQNHMRNHRAERRFVCTYCTKAFSQSNNLRAHLRIHTNERPYKCNECGKAFTQVTNLNNHIRLHTGERPFACPEPGCNKAYAQVTNLNQHRKRHINGRPLELTYDCNVCGAQFDQRNHMYMHRKQEHPEHVPPPQRRTVVHHTCHLCGETFPSQRQLDRHSLQPCSEDQPVQIKVEPAYKCMFENCGRAFAEAAHHQEHLLKAHQLRVKGNFAPAKPPQPPQPPQQHTPNKRGRPPKVKPFISVSVSPPQHMFQFVDPEHTEYDVERTRLGVIPSYFPHVCCYTELDGEHSNSCLRPSYTQYQPR